VNSQVEIAVSDTGVGIPRAFLPHIFERFRQADAGTTRERGGLGLGLSITRHLVEMHGGSIDVFSDGEGTGSTFRVSLPLMIVRHERRGSEREHPRQDRPDTTLTIPDLRDVRVLAVDDDPDALLMVRDILESAGAIVSMAGSAGQALEMLGLEAHDVLLSDLGMPQRDGFSLISEVRQSAIPSIRAIPAAALTAYARSEDRARALRSGFQIHLAKPIDPSELMAAIAALTRRTPVQ
jgi:CheY-like chemotaxis protein